MAQAPTSSGLVSLLSGGVSDILQGLDVLRGWVQAQDGLQFEGHTFVLAGSVEAKTLGEGSTSSASAAGRELRPKSAALQRSGEQGQVGPASSSAARAAPAARRPNPIAAQDYPIIRIIEQDRRYGLQHDARFGLIDARLPSEAIACTVALLKLEGWDSAIGNQAAISFDGADVPGSEGKSYALSFVGWVNRAGIGFLRFAGMVVVSAGGNSLTVSPAHCRVHGEPYTSPTELEWDNGYTINAY